MPTLQLYQLSTINYQLSTINYQLSTINYQLSTINYQLSTIYGHEVEVPGGCRVVYRPHNPKCGARVWIESLYDVLALHFDYAVPERSRRAVTAEPK